MLKKILSGILILMVFSFLPVSAERSKSASDPTGFVLLSDVAPKIIQEIRYYSTYNFIGDRIDGYDAPCALMTIEAAEALKKVSDDVEKLGYRLKIFDAYRPQKAVDHFMRWAKDANDTRMKKYFYPEIEKNRIILDLTLFDMNTGKELDMGGTFDYFGELSHPDYKRSLTQQQIKNRQILRNAMVKNGFKPIKYYLSGKLTGEKVKSHLLQ